MRKLFLLSILSAAWMGLATASDSGALAKQSREILQKFCYKCHNPEEDNYFNVLDRKSLLTTGKGNDKPYLAPGKLDQSLIWLAAADPAKRNMPPGTRQKLNETEASTLKQWIEAGAPEAPVEVEAARKQITEIDILKAIRDHLDSVPPEWKPYQRYFSIANLHNAPGGTGLRAGTAVHPRGAFEGDQQFDVGALTSFVPAPVAGTEDTVYVIDIPRSGMGSEQ